MPEREEPAIPRDQEGETLESELAEKTERARKEFESIFDSAQERGLQPAELYLQELSENNWRIAAQIYGEEKVHALCVATGKVTSTRREDFVAQMMLLVAPLLEQRVLDPATRVRAEAIEEAHARAKEFHAGKLIIQCKPFDSNITLGDGTMVQKGDRVYDIVWPSEGDSPRSVHDIQDAFHQIATALRDRQEVKAVGAVSWMMGRPIAAKLGFQLFPEYAIPAESVSSILSWAESARKDKPYAKGGRKENVVLGVMSREEFLRRYGG